MNKELVSTVLELALRGIVEENRSLAENDPLNLLNNSDGLLVFERLREVNNFDQEDFIKLVNRLLDETE